MPDELDQTLTAAQAAREAERDKKNVERDDNFTGAIGADGNWRPS